MELMDAVEKRRAYRSLSKVEIGEELIRGLGEVVSLAPSCFNKQPWRFVFVYDEDVLQRTFTALSGGNKWGETASMIVAVFSRRDLDCPTKDREYYIFDSGMATAYLILRLTDLGLVAHPIAGYNEDVVKDVLRIPADMTVLTLLICGRKSNEINPVLTEGQIERERNRPERMALEEFVFHNRFQAAK
jgi:nitroreductase